MATKQYDLSSNDLKLFEERAQRRAVLRHEFLKQKTDPFKHGHGGTVFDPAFYRYQAAHATVYEHFRPTARNGLFNFCLTVLPMIVYGYYIHKSRSGIEEKYRRGEVAYKDRRFKFC